MIKLDDKIKGKQSDERLEAQLVTKDGDKVIWIDFSFDEKLLGIYRLNSHCKVFSLADNEVLNDLPKANYFHFHDSLPVLYSVEMDISGTNNSFTTTDYQHKKQKTIKIRQNYFDQIDPSALYVDYGIIGYKVNDSIYKIVNTITEKSTSIILYGDKPPRMISLYSKQAFWVYNGWDSLFELNRNDLLISGRYKLKNAADDFINWQNDYTIAHPKNDFLFFEDIRNGKTDSLMYPGMVLQGKAGPYLIAKIKKDGNTAEAEKTVLTKPQFLKPEDKIKYFDSIYPLAAEHKKH